MHVETPKLPAQISNSVIASPCDTIICRSLSVCLNGKAVPVTWRLQKKEILTDKTFEVCIDFSFDTLKINIERPVEYA